MSYVLERRVKTLETLVSGLSAPELGFLDGVTAGTAAASKALVLNSSGGIATVTSATITTLTSTTGNITTVNATTVAATTVTAGTVTPTAINIWNTVRQSADVVKDDGAAASALTGLVHTVVAGTYAYRAMIQCLSTANGGAKITMDLTTAVLTSIQNVARAFTASGVACARSTTATDNAVLYGATAAITQIELEGTMVVSTGGTIQLNAEQNASHADESTFYTGSTFSIQRIA